MMGLGLDLGLVYIEPGDSGSSVILAGSSQRKSLDFDKEFAELEEDFGQLIRSA